MTGLVELDRVTSELAAHAFAAVPMTDWERVQIFLKSTPDGSVRARSYDFLLSGGNLDQGSSPNRNADQLVDDAAAKHWRLTQDLGQPRWYKMIVTVERSGKFSVDFEYKDDYREGDIMKRG